MNRRRSSIVQGLVTRVAWARPMRRRTEMKPGGRLLFDGFSTDDLEYARKVEQIALTAGFTPTPRQIDRITRRARGIQAGGDS